MNEEYNLLQNWLKQELEEYISYYWLEKFSIIDFMKIIILG